MELYKQNKEKRERERRGNRIAKTKYQISLLSCTVLPGLFMCGLHSEKRVQEK